MWQIFIKPVTCPYPVAEKSMHTLQYYFFKTNFNIIFNLRLDLSIFPTEILHTFLFSSYVSHALPILLDLITLIILFGEE